MARASCLKASMTPAAIFIERNSWNRLVEGDGSLALPVDVKLENIGPRIMSRDVKSALGRADRIHRDARVENTAVPAHGAGDDLAPRRDNDGISVVDPLVRIGIERLPGREVRGQGACAEHRSPGDHPAAALAG